MKVSINIPISILFLISFSFDSVTTYAQCTEAKDSDMAKYKRLTETQDAQGCSQCAILALYFCSARNTVTVEDKRMVSSLITQTKRNIVNMGQPYCCPELVNREPQWGKDVASNSSSGQSLASGNESNNVPGKGLEIATIAAEIGVNLLSDLLDERQAKKEMERKEEENREIAALENSYKSEFLDVYQNSAESGSKIAQMKLVFEAKKLNIDFWKTDFLNKLTPNWHNWTMEAAKNNNLDAMNFIAEHTIYDAVYGIKYDFGLSKEEGIQLLEEAAHLGSKDAMLMLGKFYSLKKFFGGGGDSEKAFYWILKAEEIGSSIGNYLMGMIYRYGDLDLINTASVKFKMKKDDQLAFEFFQKSISITDEIETDYSKSTFMNSIISNPYLELSTMYRKGIACEKNIVYADELAEVSNQLYQRWFSGWKLKSVIQ